jgi:phage shock protein C
MPKQRKQKTVERRFDDFGEEIDALGKRVSKKGSEWNSWFYGTLGIVGPFISSLFGLIVLGIITWFIAIINGRISSVLFSSIHDFLIANMGIFFAVFLFFSYTSYFSRIHKKGYRIFSPVSTAVGITIVFWIVAKVLTLVNMAFSIENVTLTFAAMEILTNLSWVFVFFLVLGYIFLGVKSVFHVEDDHHERIVVRNMEKPGMHRLYRSGKDRILGGVCGGIAEYLGVDPTIIRLLWILGTLFFGFGILLYIIAWIIIPRNPKQKWKE